MPKAALRTLLSLLVVICAIIPGANAGVTVSSGIEGQALIGPTCPVARVGDRKCADRPYHTTIIVKTLDGREVARVPTDAQGKFRAALEPEFYSISTSSAKRMQVVTVKDAPVTLRLPDHQVQVVVGRFTAVKLIFDSGIR
jgi:hypothetical protein